MLVGVATFLAREVKSLLVGEAADPELLASRSSELADDDPNVERVLNVLTLQQGPGEIVVAMKLKMRAGHGHRRRSSRRSTRSSARLKAARARGALELHRARQRRLTDARDRRKRARSSTTDQCYRLVRVPNVPRRFGSVSPELGVVRKMLAQVIRAERFGEPRDAFQRGAGRRCPSSVRATCSST